MGVYRQSKAPAEVKIPVLPYVRKVLLHEYGPEPILINNLTVLGKAMYSTPLDFPDFEPAEVRGEAMKFHISHNLYGQYKQYKALFQSGCYFEKVAQRMLLAHIEAQQRIGGKILDAIEDWFEMYGIEEGVDYRLDAAYELWKAFKKKRARHLARSGSPG